MRWALNVYRRYVGISLASAAAYKLDFVTTLVITFLSSLGAPLIVVLTYGAGAAVPGYTFHETLLVQSVFMMSTGLGSLLFGNAVWITMEHVREGTYDILLLKPGPAILVTVASSFEIGNIGTLVSGAAMFVYCARFINIPSALSVMQFILLFAMGLLAEFAMILIMSATAFKWVGNVRIYDIYDSVTAFGKYPGTIYKGALKAVMTFAVPVLLFGSFPAAALLGNPSAGMFAAAGVSALLFAFGLFLFNKMIRKYQSAGG